MAFFNKFRKKTASGGKILKHLERPALRLSWMNAPHYFSKFGGPPTVPKEFEWPMLNGESLPFLLQLRLSDINKDGYLPDLPQSGLLYVFFDIEWSFDPTESGSWRIMFFEETDQLKMRRYPKDLKSRPRYKERNIQSEPILTYPPAEDDRIVELIGGDEESGELYYDLRYSVYGDEPIHHIGGYADPIQDNEMDLECQLLANGFSYDDERTFDDKRREWFERGRDEWTLLIQIDSDDEVEMMWGDVGTLYFWIKKSDLKAKNFDNVWMIWQCY